MNTNIVLSIDGVLACRSVDNLQQANFFKNKGAILTAIKTHYILPGVIEFIKLLFQTENIKVSFFSSGDKMRNIIFVDRLLKLALPEVKYEEIKSKVCILSRDDLIKASDKERREHHELYDFYIGEEQKDISKALGEGDLLENAVLIDDDSSYIAYGQTKNFLRVRESKNRNFEQLPSKCDSYEADGYKFLHCVLANNETSGKKRAVKEGGEILILKTEEGFELGFLNKWNKYQRKVIFHEEHDEQHKALFLELNKVYQINLENNESASVINDKELIKQVCDLVASFEGKARKICRQANRICYITGLLFTAMEASKSKNISISEVLFQTQFKLKKGKETYEFDFRRLHKRDELYLIGLEKLKEMNSNLQLINPHIYSECIKLPISEKDQQILKEALENQERDCCIM